MSIFKRLNEWEKSESGKRVIRNVILSLFAAVNVCFFTPMDFYLSHALELSLPINPAIPLGVLTAVVFAAAMTALSLTKGRAGAAVRYVLFSVSLAFYIQANFLSIHMGALDGSRYTVPIWKIVLNLALWLVILAAPFFFARKHSETVETAVYFVSGAVLLIQIITLCFSLANLMTTIQVKFDEDRDLFDHSERYVCTSKYLKEYSTDKNLIIIMPDEYDSLVFDQAFEAEPDSLSELDGFTYYKDALGMYTYTNWAAHSIFTGEKCDTIHLENGLGQIITQYDNLELFDRIKENYKTGIYCSASTFPEKIFKNYAENYLLRKTTFKDISVTTGQLIKLSFFRGMPELFKNPFLVYGEEFGQVCDPSGESTNYYPDNMAFYNSASGSFSFTDEPCFKFIHIYGLHLPRNLNADLSRHSGNDSDPRDQGIAVNKVINRYLAALKENGIYDNSDIFIMADHGLRDVGGTSGICPLLMYKPAHQTETGLKISNAPISHEDLYPTLLKLAGGETDKRTLFDIKEDEQRTRVFAQYGTEFTGTIDKESLE